MVNQVEGNFGARDQHMCQYLKLIKGIRYNFRADTVNRIPRNQNSHADSLATLASSPSDLIPRLVLVEALEHPSIELQMVVATISEQGLNWMEPYVAFLSNESLPKNEKEVEKVRRTVAPFWLSSDKKLY